MRLGLAFLAAKAVLPTALGYGFGFGFTQQNGQERLLGSSFGFPGTDQTFDYVIVGGGTSGLVVAKRLAENPDLSVAIIEAGGFYELDAGNFSQVPAYETLYASAPSTIDWEIYTTNQTQLLGQSIRFSQGKCFGGSSARNNMVYQRGTTGSYQAWAAQVGDESYTLANLLPFFKKSVKFTPPNYRKRGGPAVAYDSSAYSPRGGPLQVSYWNYFVPVSQYFKNGLTKLGFKETSGIESGSLIGFAQYPATLNPDAQIRDSSETSYLQEAIQTTGLQVYQRTLAKKIVFNGKRASGVLVDTAGIAYTLYARKEVILAAGVFRTPQLLMVSGIGSEATLRDLNIPCIANLAGVGQSHQDQPGYGIAFPVNVTTQHQLYSNATYMAAAQKAFISSQSGDLTVAGSNYLAWEHLPASYSANLTSDARTDLSKYPADWPDLQYILSTVGLATNASGNYAAVGLLLMKTTSRGNVTISSVDTADNPVVNVNWLTTSTDQQLAVQGLKRAREIAASFGIINGPEVAPGAAVQTDGEIIAFIKASVGPSHHAVGSCKMGKADDLGAVVDTKGLVLGGVQGLRIVDSSVMALLPPGQPQATVYMLAEKFAADILDQPLG